VLQAITYTLDHFLIMPTIAHIKGHQDSAMAYALLPLDLKLNVDANAAATLFQAT
jgi:hypothetical protein